MSEIKELKKFCRVLAKESGNIIQSYYRKTFSIETKSDLSPVTIADRKAEEKMRELIQKEFPEHGIVGEEFGIHNENAEYKWILDPIDGTKSFIGGTPLFGTLIAVTKNNAPILGVINHSALNEYLIGDNVSCELNGEQVRIRECNSVSEALMVTTDHLNIHKYQNGQKFDEFTKNVKIYRGWGDCYGYYLLATGYADIVLDPIMSVWDLMALIPVVQGAGGTITDYQGFDASKGKSIIASNKVIHEEVVKMLN